MRSKIMRLWLVLSLFVPACSGMPGDESYDESLGSSARADLIDNAVEVALNSAVEGEVGGEQMLLYRVALKKEDRFTATQTVTSGDLQPHFKLFYGTNDVHSLDWKQEGTTLIKKYQAYSSGLHLIMVQSYKKKGAGAFKLELTCTGGPCNGQFPVEELDFFEVDTCLRKAHECSFNKLPSYAGAVGEARAKQIFSGCIEQSSTDDGASCKQACDRDEASKEVCDGMTKSLVFYADQTNACTAILHSCLSDCRKIGGNGYPENGDTMNEYICFTPGGFNGDCDSYARQRTECGGTLVEGSYADCGEYVESTDGAWTDDLDTMIEDSCDQICDNVNTLCQSSCGATDKTCYDKCVKKTDASCAEQLIK